MSSSRVHTVFTGAPAAFARHRLDDVVRDRIRPAAEAAAEEVCVDVDLLGREAGGARGVDAIDGLELRAGPDLAAVALARRPRSSAAPSGRGPGTASVSASTVDAPLSAASTSPSSRATQPGCRRRAARRRPAARRLSTPAPSPWSQVSASASRPFFAAQNQVGDAPRRPTGTATTYVTPFTRRARVASISSTRAPNTGGRATSAVSMPGTCDVEAERRRAGDLLAAVQAQRRLADEPELRGIFQLHVARHRHRAGLVDQLAVGQRAGPPAQHAPVRGADAGPAHVPGRGGGGQQHLARGGARPAQRSHSVACSGCRP